MMVHLNEEDIDRVSGGFDCEWNHDFPDPRQIFLIEEFFSYKTGRPSIFGPTDEPL